MLRRINGVFDFFIRRPSSKIRVLEFRFPDISPTHTPYSERYDVPKQTFVDNTVVTSKYTLFTFVPRYVSLLLIPYWISPSAFYADLYLNSFEELQMSISLELVF